MRLSNDTGIKEVIGMFSIGINKLFYTCRRKLIKLSLSGVALATIGSAPASCSNITRTSWTTGLRTACPTTPKTTIGTR